MITALTWISGLAWGWLLLFRGRFWIVEPVSSCPEPSSWPEVVAVIPARDEATVIGAAVTSLLGQDYPGFLSVVVADDASQDGTASVALAAAGVMGAEDRLSVLQAPPLPSGWSGKMWAQSQALEMAVRQHPEAELWLLTDADIAHHASELRRMVARLLAEQRDMASLMVRLATSNWIEQAIIPAFVFFFRLLYPFRWVGDASRPTAAAAGGYILIRRAMLERIGGLAAVQNALIDDCSLAAAVKRAGGRLSLDLADHTVSLRGYDDWKSLWMMIARSAYTQLKCSPWLLAGTVLAMTVGFLLPPMVVLFGAAGFVPGLLAWAAMSLAYWPMTRFYRRPVLTLLLLPLVALFYLGATLDSARRHWMGKGGEWKGRMQAEDKR
ncbi:MAG TPA: glycosyltransferase [Rhodospirillaceae bacterium]|nr:glycosyltransferase [Rhodospirillaceae bacterium]